MAVHCILGVSCWYHSSVMARMMRKFFTAATKSSALPVLRDPQVAGAPGLLNVLQRVRLRGPLSRALPGRRFRRFVTRTYA